MSTTDPDTPRGPARQLTVRMYSEADAARFDALVASHFGGKPGAALEAIIPAGMDVIERSTRSTTFVAPGVPESPVSVAVSDGVAIEIEQVKKCAVKSESASVSPPAPALGNTVGNRLGIALGGLALAVATAALGVALRTAATPAVPDPTNPTAAAPTVTPAALVAAVSDQSVTRADLAKITDRVSALDVDVVELGEVVKEQKARIDKLSPPAIPAKPAGSPGR